MATREEMKKEAIARMELMKIRSETIKEFEKEDVIMADFDMQTFSVNKAFETTQNIQKMMFRILDRIKRFENEFGVLVFHVVVSGSLFATFLYVSDREEEWKKDRENITDDNYAVAYVYNIRDPYLSELGGIQFKCEDGIIVRTA